MVIAHTETLNNYRTVRYLVVFKVCLSKFFEKINITPTCWEWLAYKDKDGYGNFRFDYKMYQAHRFSYLLYKGEIPKGLQLDHLCRNRSCVNPEHLEAVSCKENVNRGINHNKIKTHCPKGHKYTDENTYKNITEIRNSRHCKICVKGRCNNG